MLSIISAHLFFMFLLFCTLILFVLELFLKYYNELSEFKFSTSFDDDADGAPLFGTSVHHVELLQEKLIVHYLSHTSLIININYFTVIHR